MIECQYKIISFDKFIIENMIAAVNMKVELVKIIVKNTDNSTTEYNSNIPLANICVKYPTIFKNNELYGIMPITSVNDMENINILDEHIIKNEERNIIVPLFDFIPNQIQANIYNKTLVTRFTEYDLEWIVHNVQLENE